MIRKKHSDKNENVSRERQKKLAGGKGNDGGETRRHKLMCFFIVIALFICIFFFNYSRLFSESEARTMSAMAIVNEKYHYGSKDDKIKILPKIRSRDKKNSLTDVLSGKLHLVGVRVPLAAIDYQSKKPYGDSVIGVFCELDWAVYRANPPKFPMFRDLLNQSEDCRNGNKVSFRLNDVAKKARTTDSEALPGSRNELQRRVVPFNIPPTGFVFHESRVGSTLVANSLTAMDPESHRVYSESAPLLTAMMACKGDSNDRCNVERVVDLIRDVVYLMGRSNDPKESRLFYKIQSIGVAYVRYLRLAFPDTPWAFVFREPVQVMMSHLQPQPRRKEGGKHPYVKNAVCLRTRGNPPKTLQDLIRNNSGRKHDDLSYLEFCSAHLAWLCENAISEQTNFGKGRMIDYATLPGILLDDVIPNHFGVPVSDSQRQRVLAVADHYSKGKGANVPWKDDTERKETEAPPRLRRAATAFLAKSHAKLKALESSSSSSS